MRILTLVLLLTACAGEEDAAKDDTAGGGDDTGDTNDTVDPDVTPEVLSVDLVDCAEQQSAGEVWQIQISVDDPQGADTIAGGTLSVQSSEGGELADYDLACGGGSCFGGFRADYDGIGCSLIGDIKLVFTVTDEDGNTSAPRTYDT